MASGGEPEARRIDLDGWWPGGRRGQARCRRALVGGQSSKASSMRLAWCCWLVFLGLCTLCKSQMQSNLWLWMGV